MYIENVVLYWIFLMKAAISYATGHFSFLPKSPMFTGNGRCVFGSAKYPDMPPDILSMQLPRQRKFVAQDIYESIGCEKRNIPTQRHQRQNPFVTRTMSRQHLGSITKRRRDCQCGRISGRLVAARRHHFDQARPGLVGELEKRSPSPMRSAWLTGIVSPPFWFACYRLMARSDRKKCACSFVGS